MSFLLYRHLNSAACCCLFDTVFPWTLNMSLADNGDFPITISVEAPYEDYLYESFAFESISVFVLIFAD